MINILFSQILHIFILKLSHYSFDLLCRNKRSLNSDWEFCTWIHIEHISLSYEIFCSFTTQNRSTINLTYHSKSNSRWNIRLNHTRNNIYWRSLSSQDQMNSNRSCLRCKTVNTVFNFLFIGSTRNHHIRHFINDNYDTIHFFFRFSEHFLIIFIEIFYSFFFQNGISSFHLFYCPLQKFDCLSTFKYNWRQKIRQTWIHL